MQPRIRHEFPLRPEDFRFIADRLRQHAGIVLHEHKREMVYGRLVHRLRELGLASFAEYCQRLQGPAAADELGTMVNALTTNLTGFFREAHHFEALRTSALPELVARGRELGRRLRLWSAACSSGEEPYSMAATLLASGLDLRGWDVRILATDLDTNMLAKAREGIYGAESMGKLPQELRARLATPVAGRGTAEAMQIRPALRQLISFRQLNLLERWPMRGPFDVIFCRNVLIYFDAETKAGLIDRFRDLLRPGGWLCLGHSESLLSGPSDFRLVGRTIYRRAA